MTAPVPATRTPLGRHFGVAFDAVAWSPDAAEVDLSIACMFEREADGAALRGGLRHLDDALGGYLTATRASGHFQGRELDTLLISRPPSSVRARAVMVIGLGDPDELHALTLERACAFAVACALRQGARTAAFAPNLLDAGLVVRPEWQAAAAMSRGALSALALAERTLGRGLGEPAALRSWVFDVGLAHFAATAQAFTAALVAQA